jgi:hypothetical protein
MGSFTAGAATMIMRALFPSSTTSNFPIQVSLTGATTATTAASFRIYNNHTAAGSQWGIFCGSATNVLHTCHLVVGTTNASGNPSIGGNGLTDANFTTNPAIGGIGGTTTAGGTMSYPWDATASYVDYRGKTMVTSGGTTHTWTGWALTETSNKGQAVSASQIGFPALGTSSTAQNVFGFVITSQGATAGTDVASPPVSGASLVATNAGGAPMILAYGDLSNGRQLTTGDTPVFATGAITITLE